MASAYNTFLDLGYYGYHIQNLITILQFNYYCFEENNPRAAPLYGLYGDVPMVFDFSVLNRVLIVISCESVINRVLYSK